MGRRARKPNTADQPHDQQVTQATEAKLGTQEPVPDAVSELVAPAVSGETKVEDRSDTQEAHANAIREALAEVNSIVELLKNVLQDMQEVAELLEIAQIQRNRDTREIEQLTRMLKQLQNKS